MVALRAFVLHAQGVRRGPSPVNGAGFTDASRDLVARQTVRSEIPWQHGRVRVLLIEDDERLAERTCEYLRGHDVAVEIVADGPRGLERAAEPGWDVILLDIMLPGLDGLELCKQLRKRSNVPVIMLSARGEEVDRVVGLELGADDYMPKPFSPRELLARIRAVLRRHAASSAAPHEGDEGDEVLEIGPLQVNRSRRVVQVGGESTELTAYQFDLLWALAEGAERVLSRAQLYNRVRELRGEPPAEFDASVDRSVDVHMSKIRQAMGKACDGTDQMIRTVRGVGYVMDPAPDGEAEPL